MSAQLQATACGHRMAHRKWKETKLQPGTAVPGNMLGCCLVYFHFLWAILCPQAVHERVRATLSRGRALSLPLSLSSSSLSLHFHFLAPSLSWTKVAVRRRCDVRRKTGTKRRFPIVFAVRYIGVHSFCDASFLSQKPTAKVWCKSPWTVV